MYPVTRSAFYRGNYLLGRYLLARAVCRYLLKGWVVVAFRGFSQVLVEWLAPQPCSRRRRVKLQPCLQLFSHYTGAEQTILFPHTTIQHTTTCATVLASLNHRVQLPYFTIRRCAFQTLGCAHPRAVSIPDYSDRLRPNSPIWPHRHAAQATIALSIRTTLLESDIPMCSRLLQTLRSSSIFPILVLPVASILRLASHQG